MNYEEKYNDLLSRIKRMADVQPDVTRVAIESLFPELKESEDEKIRKSLIGHLKECRNNTRSEVMLGEYAKWIAWLEEQGEHANFRNKIQIGDKVTRNEDGVLVNLSQLNRVAKKDEKQGETFTKKDVDDAYLKGICDAKHELEKQDGHNTVVVIPKFRVGDVIRPKGSTAEYTIESISGECYHGKGWGLHISCDNDYELVEQKPINKVEPKFHDGDWVVSPNGVYWHIDKISNNRYEVTSNTGESSNWPLDTNIYHKFTIQDAKDGDIIIDPATQYEKESIFIFERIDENNVVRCYVTLSNMQTLRISNDICNVCGYADKILYTPASKEQRDLLFQKMHEAGYYWDAENKQLRKIEQKSLWGEDDVAMLDSAIAFVEHSAFTTIGKSKNNVIAWLKSLKERLQPKQKWSEEDIMRIDNLIAIIKSRGYSDYVECLEKLKERYVWKPSDEQIEALLKLEEMHVLEHEKNQENAHLYMVVKSIREQLLKLREE